MRKFFSSLIVACLTLMMTIAPASAHELPATPEVTSSAQLIAEARASDPVGFTRRLSLIHASDAFMLVLQQYTSDPDLNAEFFAAISTDAQALDLLKNTRGKHYVISGSQEDPDVQLVEGSIEAAGPTPMAMPACPKAWAAFAAWLAGTTLLCAPFSGPAAWACAIGMGLLGLMPDFNNACK